MATPQPQRYPSEDYPLAHGQLAGSYELLEPLGQESLWPLYSAINRNDGKRVALRELPASETLTVPQLHHSKIAGTIEEFRANEKRYVVRTFVPGKSVADLLQAGAPISKELLLSAMRDVAEAIDFAHSQGVLHGRLLSSKIIISGDGSAKLTDFAIRRGGDFVDDLQSLATVAQQIVDANRIQPQPGLVKVFERALTRSAEGRFTSAREFVAALSIALSGHQARPAREPLASKGARSSLPIWIAVCFLLAASAAFLFLRMTKPPSPTVQVLQANQPAAAPVPRETVKPPAHEEGIAAPPPPNVDERKMSKRRRREMERAARAAAKPSTPVDNGIKASSGGVVNVEILTDPPGADIRVDGASGGSCIAPCSLPLLPGRHVLTAGLKGHTSRNKVFSIPEEDKVFVNLGTSLGIVVIASTPPGARVRVDGRDFGVTPVTLRLPSGVHRLSLSNGTQSHQETLEVEPESFQSRSIRW